MDKARILLVEDDALIQKLYSDILNKEQFQVETASDGKTAYEKIKSGGWDLILLDVFLPQMNGIEIIKKLTDETGTKLSLKLVFLTNLESGPEIDEINKLGYDYILKTNLNPQSFLNKINYLLSDNTSK